MKRQDTQDPFLEAGHQPPEIIHFEWERVQDIVQFTNLWWSPNYRPRCIAFIPSGNQTWLMITDDLSSHGPVASGASQLAMLPESQGISEGGPQELPRSPPARLHLSR